MLSELNIISHKRSAAWRRVALALQCEFPELALRYFANPDVPDAFGPHRDGQRVLVSVPSWCSPMFDPSDLDAPADACAAEGPFSIWLVAGDAKPEELEVAAVQVATRCQRHLPMRNLHSMHPLFDRIAEAHRGAHDLQGPLVAADLAHAVDTHRWIIRLEPEASLAVQLAALFHDIERLISEADQRIEQHASDYVAYKRAHAAAGAAMARDILCGAGAPEELAERVSELVATQEQPDRDDPDLILLNEADALSFFSLNASGFLNYFGRAHTANKVRYTWNRLGARGRSALATVRHHPIIAAMLPVSLSLTCPCGAASGAIA